MALGDAYATLDELKVYLSILDEDDESSVDQYDDLKLSDALMTASREIEAFCDRQFNKTETSSSRLYRPKGCKVVTIDDFYSTDDLVIETDSGYSGDFNITWQASGYELEPLNGIVSGSAGWPYYRIRAVGSYAFPVISERASLRVTAKWGWTDVPAPVKQACLVIASEIFKLKDAPFGVVGYGDYGVRVKNSPVAMRMLAPYQRNPVKVG